MGNNEQNGANNTANHSHDAKSLSILYKRKGHFDTKRDEILSNFQKSEAHEELLKKVKEIVTSIVKKNPELLLKNKGQLAALIEGTISRSTTTAVDSKTKLTAPNGLASSSNTLMNSASGSKPTIQIENPYGNLLEIFDEEVKQNTIGSQELRDSIRAELQRLRGD